MVSFRYHLVSLGALLLALAAGVVLGAGPLSAKVSDALDKPVATASGPFDRDAHPAPGARHRRRRVRRRHRQGAGHRPAPQDPRRGRRGPRHAAAARQRPHRPDRRRRRHGVGLGEPHEGVVRPVAGHRARRDHQPARTRGYGHHVRRGRRAAGSRARRSPADQVQQRGRAGDGHRDGTAVRAGPGRVPHPVGPARPGSLARRAR